MKHGWNTDKKSRKGDRITGESLRVPSRMILCGPTPEGWGDTVFHPWLKIRQGDDPVSLLHSRKTHVQPTRAHGVVCRKPLRCNAEERARFSEESVKLPQLGQSSVGPINIALMRHQSSVCLRLTGDCIGFPTRSLSFEFPVCWRKSVNRRLAEY